jgi:hypothetical protein
VDLPALGAASTGGVPTSTVVIDVLASAIVPGVLASGGVHWRSAVEEC